MDPHLNGRLADGPPPNPLTVQTAERLVRKVLAEAVDLTSFQQVFDPWDLLLDTGTATGPRAGSYPAWPMMNYRQSQKRGEDLPYYYDENQLRFIRDRQRKLVAENPFAQCAIANYTNYSVGADGLKISAVSARKDCPPRLTERAQRVIDLFIEENEFGEYCKDRVAQGHINGDAPTRLFPDEDSGILRIRPIEAEHVRTPVIGGNPYGPEYSFGVQTLPDDVEQIVGVWVVEEPLVSPLSKFVPHDQVNWLKFNSPRSSKRGIPLFARGSCEYLLRMAMRLLSAAGSTAIQRAKIGLIKYLDGVINDAAKKLAAEVTNYTVTDPRSGQAKSIQEYPDGAIIQASGNQRWEMPGSNFDAQVFEVAGKMILRAVAAYLNFPEFMLTADPSSGTFANAFIAEAPSTRAFESFQHDFIRRVAINRSRSRRSIVWAQIVHAVKCGILAPETLHLVQIQAEGPTMVVRDQNQEANTNKTYHEMGVLSKKTIQLKIGVDPDQEDENLEAEAAKAKKPQPAAPAVQPGQEEPDKEDPDGRGPGPREPDDKPPPKPGGVAEGVDDVDGIDTEHLAHFYAELWAGKHPKDIGDHELATVHDELGRGAHTLAWDEKDGWHVVTPAAECVVEAVHRSPKGGINIAGKEFRGGMFIPAKDYANASEAEKAAIDNPAQAAVEKRRGRGAVDKAKLRQKLQAHSHQDLSADEKKKAGSSLAALQHHHGDLTHHRLDELVDQLQAQLDRTPESKADRRQKLTRRLKAVNHQLDVLDAKARKKEPWKGGEPDHARVYQAPTSEIHVDPERFQFKLNTDRSGVTDEFKSVQTFNPEFAGVLLVWKDPADGKTYAINGHHRHELATRTGHPDLAVRYIDAQTANEARARGALANIAEGRGTAVDAAKFMRDTGVSVDDMTQHGISLKGKVATDAVILTKLNDRLFDRVARGSMDQTKALAIAKHLHDPSLQDQLVNIIDKREDANKDTSPKVIEEMAREMAHTPTTQKTGSDLFGDFTSEESLFVERNEVKSYVRTELAKEVNDYLAVSSKRRAERVKAAGNVLDPEANKRIAQDSERVLNVFDTLVNRKGKVSDAINETAAEYAKAKTKRERDAVRQQAIGKIRDAVFAEAGIDAPDSGGKGAGPEGSGQGHPGEPRPKTEAASGDGRRGEDAEDGLTGLLEAVDYRALVEFAQWDESKHDRADDGKFGSGGDGASSDEATPGADKPSAGGKEHAEKANQAAAAMEKLGAEVAPAIAADPEVKAHAETVYQKVRRVVGSAVFEEFPKWAVEHADVWVFEEIMNASTGTGAVLAVKAANFAAAKAYLVGRKLWKKMRGVNESIDGPADIDQLARRLHELMQEIALHAGWKAPSLKDLTERLKASAP